MAVGALEHSVRAEQRKPVLVLLQLLGAKIPPLHGVTLLAIRAELAAVNIRMAICATSAHIFEYGTCMALRASDLLVHATQGVARSVVIELRNATDRLPTCICMAVFARDADRSVRIPTVLFLRLGPRRLLPDTDTKQQPEEQREYDRFPHHPHEIRLQFRFVFGWLGAEVSQQIRCARRPVQLTASTGLVHCKT